MGGTSIRYFLGQSPDGRLHVVPAAKRGEWQAWLKDPSLHTVGIPGDFILGSYVRVQDVEFALAAWPGKQEPPFTLRTLDRMNNPDVEL